MHRHRTNLEVKTLNDVLADYDKVADAAAKAGISSPVPDSAQTNAKSQLQGLATALAMDTASTRFILVQIAHDPYTAFGCEVWPNVTFDLDEAAPAAATA